MATAPMTFAGQNWRMFREGLYDVFLNEANAFASRIPDVFQVADSQRAYEELQSYAPIGDFDRWTADGDTIGYEVPTPRYLTTVTHLDYSKGISYTKKMKREFKYKGSDIMNSTRAFARSAAHTKEKYASAFLTGGFTNTWTDGVATFAATHPLAVGASAATCSNLATGALSFTTLSTAIALLRAQVDDMGRPMMLEPEVLVVPSALELLAWEILKSPDRPDATERAKSTLYRLGINIVVWPYLDAVSDTGWYLRAPLRDTGGIFFNREQLTQKIDTDNRNTWSDYHSAAYCCSYGAKTWRGWVASTGL